MIYQLLSSTGRHISKYDEYGELSDIHSSDLVENSDCETCENCHGEGCEICNFEGYIDFSEPNGCN